MTPAARVQAAIEVLDGIGAGTPAEQALTRWARRSRFAGSGDRAAVRDHVFAVLRAQRSCAALGGGIGGRSLLLGQLRLEGIDPDTVFGAGGHGPAPLSEAERSTGRQPVAGAESADLPDWLWPYFRDALGDDAPLAAAALRGRAPVFLRANLLRTDRQGAIDSLATDGVTAVAHPAADTALQVTGNARRVRNSRAYLDGLVELQDAASQAVVAALSEGAGRRALDYCAGGGGKALALAARGFAVTAHDAAPRRMADLPARAARAGAQIAISAGAGELSADRFDLVLCDVPCSGSGSWRRAPAGKWTLTAQALEDLLKTQKSILAQAARHVAPGGVLAYVTCSVLDQENADQISDFTMENSDWTVARQQTWSLIGDTDGFFTAQLTRR